MIPDFKTYIGESTWGDMARRAEGEQIRKEDNVDFLEPDDFITYIEKNYSMDNSPMEIINNKASSTIFIPICTALRGVKIGMIFFDYDNMDVYTHNSIQIYIPRLWKKLNTFFDLSSNHFQEHYNTSIKPKDVSRKITNSYVLEVLNFIIDNIDDDVNDDDVELCIFRKTNESTWGDMARRAEGEQIRKEDDVDCFDYEEFFVYLTEHYQPKSKKINEKISERTSAIYTDTVEIYVPIESINGRIKTLIIEMSKKDNSIVSMATSSTLLDKYVNLGRMLSNNYTLHTIRLGSSIYLRPKKKPTNKSVVDLIDIFLVVVDNPILEKVS